MSTIAQKAKSDMRNVVKKALHGAGLENDAQLRRCIKASTLAMLVSAQQENALVELKTAVEATISGRMEGMQGLLYDAHAALHLARWKRRELRTCIFGPQDDLQHLYEELVEDSRAIEAELTAPTAMDLVSRLMTQLQQAGTVADFDLCKVIGIVEADLAFLQRFQAAASDLMTRLRERTT